MNVDKMKKAGWQASTNLEDGIESTYNWFLENENKYKQVKL
jgi:GDP-L-fucose synthase